MSPATLVHDFLQQSADRHPGKIALVSDGRRMTYADLEALANRLANALMAHDVHRGDRVAIYLANCAEAVIAIFAALKAGAIFTCINSTTKFDKLSYILNDCRATALVSHTSRRDMLARLCAQVPSLKFVALAGAEEDEKNMVSLPQIFQESPPHRPPPRGIDIDLAAIIYTSGSTGRPKGVMCTHLNMVSASTSITQYLENVPEDIIINVLPLSFDYGLYQVLMAFQVGATLVLERGFAYPAAILNRIEEERVTGLPGVPTIFAMLLQMDLSRWDLTSLRYLTNTAAALPVTHIQQLRKAFPQAKLYSMYGLTECKRVSYLPPEELDRRPGSVGIAIPNTEVWIEDEEGRRVGPGEVGELVVRGSHVMQGYWELPEETARTFRPGRYPGERLLYTGDLFTMDEEGFLYFVSRKDDIIKSRGEKVSPKEVEDVLYRLDGVIEAAVVGVPDPLLGQAIKAYVVSKDGVGLTEKQVLRHCAAHLEDFMVPKYVEFCDSLPKTPSGKISKRSLRA